MRRGSGVGDGGMGGWGDGITLWSFKPHSHLVPEHGARVRFSLGTNVNTPFFQVLTPEFGHGARARVQGRDLVLGH